MKILSAQQVSDMTSLSIPQIRRMSQSGALPHPIRISDARVGWIQEDIEDWLFEISRQTEANNDN